MAPIRPIPYQTFVKIIESEGFAFARQSGDHLIFTKPGIKRPLVIPAYRELPVFVIKNVLRTGGISRERYFELLKEI